MSILPGAELGQRIGPMTSIMDMSRLLFAVGCFVFLSATKAAAGDWPDGCVVCENTQSPDERYGILVPSMDGWQKDESLASAFCSSQEGADRVAEKARRRHVHRGEMQQEGSENQSPDKAPLLG